MAKYAKKPRIDVYQKVTDNFIAAIEKGGAMPWTRSWSVSSGGFPTRFTGEQYQGINVLILMCSGYTNPNWMTYNQAKSIGAQVRGGEKSTQVVKWLMTKIKGDDGKVKKDADQFPYPKFFNVFNAEQVDGLPEKFFPAPAEKMNKGQRDKNIDAILTDKKMAPTNFGGDRAYYQMSVDKNQVPDFEQFFSPEDFYATWFHEAVHSTMHASRLDRSTESYAKEELVAEIGAAMCMTKVGLSSPEELRPDHVAYVASWLKALKNDKKFIFSAAKDATAASQFIVSDQMAEIATSTPDKASPSQQEAA